MRRTSVMIGILLVASSCGAVPAPGAASAVRSTASSAAAADVCRLPVWWGEPEDISPQFIHAAFIGVPSGKVTDAGRLPAQPVDVAFSPTPTEFDAASYVSSTGSWLRLNRKLLSPDASQFVYWTYGGSASNVYELHVVTVATGDDRLIYEGGTDVYLPMAFTFAAIYLGRQVLNPRSNQLVVDSLYKINPGGGTLDLVAGSSLPNPVAGWTLVADGAAWAAESSDRANHSTIYRLDLTTHAVADWYDAPSGTFELSADGVDMQHRLYVQYADHLVRVDGPGDDVAMPGGIGIFVESAGTPPFFEADSVGAWFGRGASVWLYPAQGDPKQYIDGLTNNPVYPAGPCT